MSLNQLAGQTAAQGTPKVSCHLDSFIADQNNIIENLNRHVSNIILKLDPILIHEKEKCILDENRIIYSEEDSSLLKAVKANSNLLFVIMQRLEYMYSTIDLGEPK